MDIKPVCPSCGAALKKVPQRKTKCPSCGGFIFVKYSPSNPQKRLVTQAEAEQIDAEWNAHHQAQAIQQAHGVGGSAYADLRAQMVAAFGEELADWNVEYVLLKQEYAAAESRHARSFAAFRLAILFNKRGLEFRPYL